MSDSRVKCLYLLVGFTPRRVLKKLTEDLLFKRVLQQDMGIQMYSIRVHICENKPASISAAKITGKSGLIGYRGKFGHLPTQQFDLPNFIDHINQIINKIVLWHIDRGSDCLSVRNYSSYLI